MHRLHMRIVEKCVWAQTRSVQICQIIVLYLSAIVAKGLENPSGSTLHYRNLDLIVKEGAGLIIWTKR